MKSPKTLTLIISPNYGRPITFQMELWRVYALAAATGLILLGLLLASLMLLFQYPRLIQLEKEVNELRQEQTQVNNHSLSQDRRNYHLKNTLMAKELGGVEIQVNATLAALKQREENEFQPPVTVNGLEATLGERNLRLLCRMETHGAQDSVTSGWLLFVLERGRNGQTEYLATNDALINERGFPTHYKLGRAVGMYRRNLEFTETFRVTPGEPPYTHVTVYLFSARGGLILRERVELNQSNVKPEAPSRPAAQPQA
ncbi:MAG: hypothetical protein OEV94_09835 [Deltaproteobacteria bacterium]|nr:hypothetical protein [Deltaproteobacteria bacterium]MDH4121991.1 hypothetical protein [Deltaproteobacteria bacterium]